MNILFIHEIDWSSKVVFEFHSLSEILSTFGHKVFLIDLVGLKSLHVSHLGSLHTKEVKSQGRSRAGVMITVIRPGIIKAPIADRASSFVTHYIAIEQVIKKCKIDAIVLYSVPTNGYQTVVLAKKHGIPVFFRAIDILHEMVPSKLYRIPTFSLEKLVYKNVDKILSLSPTLTEYVVRMGANKDDVILFPVSVDCETFKPDIDASNLRKSLGITPDDRVILYMGTLFDFSGLDIFLPQFSEVIKQSPNVKFLIVGGGKMFEKIKAQVSELTLSEKVILTGFKPFNLMPQFINIADLCVNPFLITEATRYIMPGKMLQYMACKKPVLSTRLPGIASMVSGIDQGVIYSDINDFGKVAISLLSDPANLEKLGEKAYSYVKKNYDEIKLAQKLETILNEYIESKNNSGKTQTLSRAKQ